MPLNLFALVNAVAFATMAALYLKRYRSHPADQYVPMAAWLRAGMYFSFCYGFAYATGTLQAALANPVFTAAQLGDPVWRSWVLALFLLISAGYWIIWARFTIRFERRLQLVWQTLFGLLWGLASGLVFLSLWHVAKAIGPDWPVWATWLLAYVLITIWQLLWQDYGWDVYVSPEHDCPWSIQVKVPATHIPNVTFALIFFAIYGNYWIFIALETWALLGAAIAMRMPGPFSRQATPAATRSPAWFGERWPHAPGFVPTSAAQQKYLRSTGLPAGTAVWLLLAHVIALLCPVLLIWQVQAQHALLAQLLASPLYLVVAAACAITAAVIELASNSFNHHSLLAGQPPGPSLLLWGGWQCLAACALIAACYGPLSLCAIAGLLATAVYLWASNKSRWAQGLRSTLTAAALLSLGFSLQQPIVLLGMAGLYAWLQWWQLLSNRNAHSLHGAMAAVSSSGMISLALAIAAAGGTINLPHWLAGVLVVTATAAVWASRRLCSQLAPTPYAGTGANQ